MSDLLVAGTDTSVGKTVIAAALVRALRERGVHAIGFKPVQSGCEDGVPTDADLLADASNEREPLAAPLLSLREPLAPAIAAERSGKTVSSQAIEQRVAALRAAGRTLVIEGAGGVLVPLVWGYTVLDLAAQFSLESVIVGRAGLGTLNHIAMTASLLRSRNIPVRAIILNGKHDPPDLAESTNPSALARMVSQVAIIEVPHHHALTPHGVIDATVPVLKSFVATL